MSEIATMQGGQTATTIDPQGASERTVEAVEHLVLTLPPKQRGRKETHFHCVQRTI